MGLWTHWTLYDLPATVTALPENLPKAPTLPNGARQGAEHLGAHRVQRPRPPRPAGLTATSSGSSPSGSSWTCRPGATRQELDRAMKGNVLAEGSLMAEYGR